MNRILAVVVAVLVGMGVMYYFTRPADGPQVAAAKKAVAEAQDGRRAAALTKAGFYRRVNCYEALIRVFNPGTGKATVWYEVLPGGYPECFDGPGYSMRTGELLQEANREFAEKYFRDHPEPETEKVAPPPELPPMQSQAWVTRGFNRPQRGGSERRGFPTVSCDEIGC
ncbi:MAG: hypothetical protein IT406_01670 [Candidatus Yanofskybacteria bacterium]|nr:hypothetical protein [Candidatus Yanofskybacteria bacterium]